jgi:hypothetical protein
MKLYVGFKWTDEDPEDSTIEDVAISTSSVKFDESWDVRTVTMKLSSLLGPMADAVPNIDGIDKILSSMQNDDELVRRLKTDLLASQYETLALDKDKEYANDRYAELSKRHSELREANEKLRNELKEAKKENKIKAKGREFIGFLDKEGDVWTPVENNKNLFSYKGVLATAEDLKSQMDAVPHYKSVNKS